MNELPIQQSVSADSQIPTACPTRVPRTAHARLLLHNPETDSSFMELLRQTLPDEAAQQAYLNHLGWQART